MAIPQGIFIAFTAMSMAASLYGSYQQKQAAARAEEQGRRQARRTERLTQEKLKRLRYNQARQRAAAQAELAAAGIAVNYGSAATYLSELELLQQYDRDWLELSGRLQAEAAIETGELAGEEARAGMWGGYANVLSQGGQGVAQYATIWGTG